MPQKEKIRNMFNRIAPDYDKLNHIMSMGIDRSWRRKALRQIFRHTDEENLETAHGECMNCGMRILDIACGTGDFSIAIAKEIRKETEGTKKDDFWPGHVTGVDLSEEMLKVMRTKVLELHLDDIISEEQGDIASLRFEDNVFDRVTVAFGVRNFEDLQGALKEMLRVLKPNGKVVILELSVPSNPVLKWLYNLYFLHIVPFVGGAISGDKAAYEYLPASVIRFPGKTEFMEIMKACGYKHITHRPFSLGICRMYTGVKQN